VAAVLEPEATPPAPFYELPVNNSRDAIIHNIRTNIRRGWPGLKQCEPTETPLAIVAGGPSLQDYLPVLRAFRADCHVLSLNGAYKHLRGLGIESNHFVLIDSRRDNIVHVDSPHEDTHHLLASQVHPDVYDSLRDYRVTLFHLATEAGMEATKDLPGPRDYLVAPIGMASIHAVYIAAALGYKKLFLFGYDFSHQEGRTYAFEQLMNKGDESFEVNLDGKVFRTTIALARTAEQFVKAISPIIRGCGLDIRMFSTGLLPALIEAQNRRATIESERTKYEQIWSVDSYRRVAPGLRDVEEAAQRLGIQKGESVADFGCGTGRCVKWFQEQGFDAVGVDIAGNCLEEDVPFVQCSLWEVEKLPSVQYGFSSDVLEHIPTEKVDDVLRAIHEKCSVGCFLDIDTIPDAFGINIGKTLHMTVESPEWWEMRIRALWPHVEMRIEPNQVVFVCRK
jgi:hypothetical protein